MPSARHTMPTFTYQDVQDGTITMGQYIDHKLAVRKAALEAQGAVMTPEPDGLAEVRAARAGVRSLDPNAQPRLYPKRDQVTLDNLRPGDNIRVGERALRVQLVTPHGVKMCGMNPERGDLIAKAHDLTGQLVVTDCGAGRFHGRPT